MDSNKTVRRFGQQWQDWVTLAVGAWLFVAPWWLYGPTAAGAVLWNSWLVGAALAMLALVAIFKFQEWEEWVNGAIGLWLIVSPWVLGFAELQAAMWNAVICGVIALAMAGEELWEIHFLRQKHA